MKKQCITRFRKSNPASSHVRSYILRVLISLEIRVKREFVHCLLRDEIYVIPVYFREKKPILGVVCGGHIS